MQYPELGMMRMGESWTSIDVEEPCRYGNDTREPTHMQDAEQKTSFGCEGSTV